jgi:hypothetical protein
VRASLIFACILGLFAYIGFIRSQGLGWDSNLLLKAIESLLNYPTVQDVVYAGAAAIDFAQSLNVQPTLLFYGAQLLPSFFSVGSLPDAARLVRDLHHTNYGMLIIGEFYLNFGWSGLLWGPFITLLYILAPLALMQRVFQTAGFAFAYYILLISLARIFWYGFIYYLKPVLLIAPALLLIHVGLYKFLRSLRRAVSANHREGAETASESFALTKASNEL